MKIVNKKKFIRMLIFIICLIAFISLLFSTSSFSRGEIKEKTIYISSGDTLWSIASEEKENNTYYKNKDIRDIILEIKKLNNIDNNQILSIGQKIIIKTL